MTVAALGQLYNSANSPKVSPGWYTFSFFYSSPIVLKQSRVPSSITNKTSPLSPYLITVSPALKFISFIASIITFISF